jgi:signal peptidase I
VLLSLLIPGAGIFLGGNRKGGLAWWLALEAAVILGCILGTWEALPGLAAAVALLLARLAVWLAMLARSYVPVPRFPLKVWLAFALCATVWWSVQPRLVYRLARALSVASEGMAPTLGSGDRLLLSSYSYWFKAPKRGELVAFRTDHLPSWLVNPGQIYAKRVFALPGETLRVQQGILLVNGVPLRAGGQPFKLQEYRVPGSQFLREGADYVVPADTFFVLGDNLNNSLDSRYFGPVQRRDILGKLTKRYWPLRRIGDVR